MSTKFIQKSTRIPIFKKNHFSISLVLVMYYHDKHSENLNLPVCLMKSQKLFHFSLMNIVSQILIICLYFFIQSNISIFFMPDQSTWKLIWYQLCSIRTHSQFFQIQTLQSLYALHSLYFSFKSSDRVIFKVCFLTNRICYDLLLN